MIDAEHERRILHADAAGVEVDAAAFAATHHLGVPCRDHHADLVRSRGDARHDALEHREIETFLEDHSEAQVLRGRPRHREIVGGAVHRQRADVAARELDRLDGEAVGREDELACAGIPRQHRRVAVGVEQRVAEVTREDLVDQLAHVAPAVAVREGNMGVQHRHERTSRPGRPIDSSGTRASSFQASSSARM